MRSNASSSSDARGPDGVATFPTGLGDGAHVFSKTLAEHEAAVRQYLIRYRQQHAPSRGTGR